MSACQATQDKRHLDSSWLSLVFMVSASQRCREGVEFFLSTFSLVVALPTRQAFRFLKQGGQHRVKHWLEFFEIAIFALDLN